MHRLDHTCIAIAPDVNAVAADHAQVAAFNLAGQVTVGGCDDEATTECGGDLAGQNVQNGEIPLLAALT
ncbi:hypothetical protein [Thiobacillus sp.]|uniref:hypothetical protein n=1 Tax=Thiobacillus sp. TaxID=924 RepID=UPI0025E71467|nr:hypothetical protein [Thiobacillus sp.]